MMSTPKPFASLSSGLLARKGHARPAMRPQSLAFGTGGASLEDLGWNDMGDPTAPAPVVPLTAPVAEMAPPVETPPVLRQRARLQAEVEVPVAPEPVAVETVVNPVLAGPAKTKAAFTLRLDPARHLRLRLASALKRHSSQRLVTEALDQFLSTMPEVEAMARQIEQPDDVQGDAA
ncbi:MAG: hypothetical protein A4S16_09850 [Proteobacteria bacterium SG_bin6]|nr:MAG: hypothetical protein A4S16_09850 [Proteobacteria bacterium SG_bin6]